MAKEKGKDDSLQLPTQVNQKLNGILANIAEESFEDYLRVGRAIANKQPVLVDAENAKIQHGTLAVKSILARTALAHVGLKG